MSNYFLTESFSLTDVIQQHGERCRQYSNYQPDPERRSAQIKLCTNTLGKGGNQSTHWGGYNPLRIPIIMKELREIPLYESQ